MSYKEQLAAAQAKMDELKAKIDASVERAKFAQQMRRDEIAADMEALD